MTEYRHLLAGRSVGLITNQTGVDENLQSNVPLLAVYCQLKALFGPEHGLSGTAQAGAKVGSGVDQPLPVYSLYGQTHQPTTEMLEGLDLLIFDIQDVGARFYTYTWPMYRSMQAASDQGLSFMVLDRPNPIGGERVAGNVSELDFLSFVGQHPIPICHGMTVGELAQLFKTECQLDLDLQVIPISTHWKRKHLFEQTGWSWIPPSPNIPRPQTAQLYIGTCLNEGTNQSEGRGTTMPFEWIGAPWLDSHWLSQALNSLGLAGIKARSIQFEPTFSKYPSECCHGIQMHLTDSSRACPIEATLHLINLVHKRYPDQFQFQETFFDKLVGTDNLRITILSHQSVEDLIQDWKQQSLAFRQRRQPYLIY